VRFEARDLHPYAEPLTESELREGAAYFIVHFADDKGLIPLMSPVVFAGVDLAGDGEGRLCFQDYHSYQQGARYSTATTGHGVECELETCLPADRGFVFEYEHALNVLLVCSLRRRGLA
jgi:hypothetical protein